MPELVPPCQTRKNAARETSNPRAAIQTLPSLTPPDQVMPRRHQSALQPYDKLISLSTCSDCLRRRVMPLELDRVKSAELAQEKLLGRVGRVEPNLPGDAVDQRLAGAALDLASRAG
jgi:hypothetical protein